MMNDAVATLVKHPLAKATIALLIIRIATIFFMGTMPQDAYYFFYAENLALSYFDHPPMIGWMLRLFTTLFGKSIYAVHFADFIVTLATVFVVYKLSLRILSKQKANHALLLFYSTFLVSILSIISTPDVPLLFFWSLSVLYAHKAITNNKITDWILAGVFMGASFLSKYTAVFLPAGLFLFLLLAKEHRKKIITYRFITVIFFFLIVISPVIIWNVQNNFISFKFQSGSRFSEISLSNLSPINFLGTIGHQLFILIPVLFVCIIFFIGKYVKNRSNCFSKISSNNLFLLSFFLPIFFFFFGISFLYWVKINWMMPGYITGIIWVSIYIKQQTIKYQLIVSLVLHVLLFIMIAFYPVPIKSDDTWWGWQKLNSEIEQQMEQRPGYFLFADDGYKTSAVLHFISGRKVYAGNLLGKPALQFTIVDKGAPQQLGGKNALFLDSKPSFTNEEKENKTPELLQQYFESVTELAPILIRNNKGKAMRKFLLYDCKNYKP